MTSRIATSAFYLIAGVVLTIDPSTSFQLHHPRTTPALAPRNTGRLQVLRQDEELLREELAQKNTNTKNEAAYSVVDGENLATVEEEQERDAQKVKTTSATDLEIARALKTRAYPLFLMEKAAVIVDDILESLSTQSDIQIGSASTSISQSKDTTQKERLVILGTGWGAAALLKQIDASRFDVTVISPRNFFLFTPMLAGASVGTVEYRSIIEPVRDINRKAKYLEATATCIDISKSSISCESVVCAGSSCTIEDFEMEYDRLIVSVGAQTNTFGIPGVREHCCFLKQVEDARKIRNAIVNCFERANLPRLSDEERESILTFAVIGAGPTGIEFASELRDFIEQDGPKYYPSLLKYVRIKVIEASTTILAPFDQSLQQAAIDQLTRESDFSKSFESTVLPPNYQLTELLLDSGVSEITEDSILLSNGNSIRYGLSVWAAGNGPLPITLNIIDSLTGDEQAEAQSVARGRIAVDPWCRALGGDGKIFAFGDCSCTITNQLPATAQVASQQGEFLARLLSQCNVDETDTEAETTNKLLPPLKDLSNRGETLAERICSFSTQSNRFAAPFQFLNLGILAYTGAGSALAQVPITPNNKDNMIKGKGKVGFGLWRSVYINKQISTRNRVLVLLDWAKTRVFGRDITRISD
eukprot:CAMPEP_0194358190 /NCGR_PEP_ID=MMETSP0174-20130528/5487_1 /TAXON_ID=216777 /ORGANISM="Proboscia alata, Strain PI-D3" /LENGTH=644 /DNA_ID=CAMNT_0039128437 /DNA_START=86 /DNA_END=2020 /DNA_ORIENTATION=+